MNQNLKKNCMMTHQNIEKTTKISFCHIFNADNKYYVFIMQYLDIVSYVPCVNCYVFVLICLVDEKQF